MFSNCPLLALIEVAGKELVVKRICEDNETQKVIDSVFGNAVNDLCKEKNIMEFDGKYTPKSEDEEILKISNFSLPQVISDALKNPQALELYSPIEGQLPPIKALFVGKQINTDGQESYLVAFQKIRNDQYITASRHHLFFTNNTFVKDSRLGLAVSSSVECVYKDNVLLFYSYYWAKQILDLSEYYRIASNQDIKEFVDNELISMENSESFVNDANIWERRKIASINDSAILQNFSAAKIKTLGKSNGVDIIVSNGKVVLPVDKAERRIVLGFLDEEVYKGAFSKTVFQTNSKRKAKQ